MNYNLYTRALPIITREKLKGSLTLTKAAEDTHGLQHSHFQSPASHPIRHIKMYPHPILNICNIQNWITSNSYLSKIFCSLWTHSNKVFIPTPPVTQLLSSPPMTPQVAKSNEQLSVFTWPLSNMWANWSTLLLEIFSLTTGTFLIFFLSSACSFLIFFYWFLLINTTSKRWSIQV